MLRTLIIEALLDRKALSVKALGNHIARKHREYSQAALYKELNYLKDQGSILWLNKKVSLHLSWVIKQINRLEDLRSTLMSGEFTSGVLPAPACKQKWNLNNLLTLNDVWNQVILSLFEKIPLDHMYEWNPHPWYDFASTNKEKLLHDAIEYSNRKTYIILGGDSYLDRSAAKTYSKDVYEVSFAKSPFEGMSNRHIGVLGDYIITVEMSKSKAREINSFFCNTTSKNDFNIQDFLNILTGKTTCWLMVEHSSVKAKKLLGKFKRFWLP